MKTPKQRQRLIELLEAGLPVTMATAASGIGRTSFYKWMADPKFAEQVEAAQARAVAPLLDRIRTAADNGQWQAAAWILERRWPGEFGRRDRLQTENTGPLEVIVRRMDSLSDDQLERIAAGEHPSKVIG
jgi:transposase